MPSPDPTVILHGGFHKTGTTHLQHFLKRNQGYLERQGVRYVHHRHTRLKLTVPVQLNSYFHQGIPHRTRMDDDTMREITGAYFAEQMKGDPARLLISDENVAGHCGQCVRGGTLYPMRRELIEAFARQVPWPIAEVHLAIRNQADFFAAAYVEFLRSLGGRVISKRFIDEAEMKRGVLDTPPRWSAVLTDIRAAVPDARVVVWRYEDYAHLRERVLSNLCGAEVDRSKFKVPKEKRSRPTASGRAIERLLQIGRRKGLAALIEHRIKVQEAFPTGEKWPRYDPWTPEERATLNAAYAEDWAKISADPGFHILTPEAEPAA